MRSYFALRTVEVQGNRILRAENMTAYSEYVHAVMHSWLEQLNEDQRREFLESVFDMLSALDAKKVDEAAVALVTRLPQIIRKLGSVDKETKDNTIKLLLSLGEATVKSLRHNILTKEKDLLNSGKHGPVD